MSNESSLALHVKNLSKNFVSYKKEPGLKGSLKSFYKREKIVKKAVDTFSFDMKQGEIVGLLGPNGAGKTTLMKMLTGIIVPSEGEVEVVGYKPFERSKEYRKNMALVMGQKSQLWWDIPAMDSFILLQKYYEIDNRDFKKRLELMTDLLDVGHILHTHVRKLSLGERMKLELMSCLLHDPKIIFLDEPTIGLDLVAQEKIREFLLNYHQEKNISMIVTSHYMADVEALCPRIVLIIDGKKRFDGKIEAFEGMLGKAKNVSFEFCDSVDPNQSIFSSLSPDWSDDHKSVTLKIPEEDLGDISVKILSDFPVKEFQTEKLPIERVLKELLENPEILQGGQ